MRKKLLLLIATLPASDGRCENAMHWPSGIYGAAEAIKAWGERAWFIQEVTVVHRITEGPPQLYVEITADDNFVREATEALAGILSKHSLRIYALVTDTG